MRSLLLRSLVLASGVLWATGCGPVGMASAGDSADDGGADGATGASSGGASGADGASDARSSSGDGSTGMTDGAAGPGPRVDGGTADGATDGAAASGGPCAPPATYHDLFVEILGRSATDVDAKVDAAFQQLFHDPTNQNNVYYEVGADQAYVWDVADNDVRSEGMSYGMMISVELDHQAEFDRLWTFAKAHMAQPSGLYAWHVTTAGSVLSSSPAPDGDEYFAAALAFASNRWGDSSGRFVYSTEARTLLDAIAHQGEFNQGAMLVDFGPENDANSFTDASYVLPAFYQAWACFDPKNQAFWQGALTASRAFFAKATNATTGLAPDHSGFDGSPSGNFMSDAWRVVVNVMMDHHFFDADPWQATFATRLGAFFKSQGPMYGDEYTPTGTVLRNDHSTGLVASNATLGFALPPADGQPFVQELWDLPVPTGQFRYYDGMLYMLALLHVSGKFHLWY